MMSETSLRCSNLAAGNYEWLLLEYCNDVVDIVTIFIVIGLGLRIKGRCTYGDK